VLRSRVQGSSLMLLVGALTACGESGSGPTPQPSANQESWYFFAVQCSNCPGLTNVELDRSSTPHRARLRVGQQTSLRAATRDGCGTAEAQLKILRWLASDAEVIGIQPSSTESAIVSALAPGTSQITAERQLPSGVLSQLTLKDVGATATTGCTALPELVIEVVP